MKLQIVEYKFPDLLSGDIIFRYNLSIDGGVVACVVSSGVPMPTEKVYSRLTRYLLDNYKDFEHVIKLNITPNGGKVLSEIEISKTFFKELKIKNRLNDLEKDFK